MLTKLVRISLPKKFRKLRLDDGPPAFDLFGESVSFRLLRAESFRCGFSFDTDVLFDVILAVVDSDIADEYLAAFDVDLDADLARMVSNRSFSFIFDVLPPPPPRLPPFSPFDTAIARVAVLDV